MFFGTIQNLFIFSRHVVLSAFVLLAEEFLFFVNVSVVVFNVHFFRVSGGGGGPVASAVPFMLSPISSHNSSNRSSNLSPGMSSYLRQNLASTPLTSNRGKYMEKRRWHFVTFCQHFSQGYLFFPFPLFCDEAILF